MMTVMVTFVCRVHLEMRRRLLAVTEKREKSEEMQEHCFAPLLLLHMNACWLLRRRSRCGRLRGKERETSAKSWKRIAIVVCTRSSSTDLSE